MQILQKKIARKFVVLENWKRFNGEKIFSNSYYQTFKDIFWSLLLERRE